MSMKTIALLLLLAGAPCGFGQTSTNLIATGDWSQTVTNGVLKLALRGRLLIYNEHEHRSGPQGYTRAYYRVYVELQNPDQNIWWEPIELYFNAGPGSGMAFEVRDSHDRALPKGMMGSWDGTLPKPFLVTLPSDSTVRLRADSPLMGIWSEREGTEIVSRVIPAKATNDFFLSAKFTPSPNPDHQRAARYRAWQGTLTLPKVRIPAITP